jgi:hypothetical protein
MRVILVPRRFLRDQGKAWMTMQVEKDVVRTDRDHPLFSAQDAPALGVMHRVLLSYVMYNQDLGYSQVRHTLRALDAV